MSAAISTSAASDKFSPKPAVITSDSGSCYEAAKSSLPSHPRVEALKTSPEAFPRYTDMHPLKVAEISDKMAAIFKKTDRCPSPLAR